MLHQYRFRKFKVLVALVLLLSWNIASSEAVRGGEILRKVVTKLLNTRDLSLSFEKSFYWELAGETQRLKGQFYLKKPRRLRLETEEQTVVSDGDTLWTYVPENKQVIISPYEQWQDPLEQILRYSESYRPTYLGMRKVQKSRCYLLQLLPNKEGEEIVQIKVWVDKKKWLPLKLQYLDLNGNTTCYLLSDVKVNSNLKDSLFKFRPPKGVEIVDMFQLRHDVPKKR
ncbi:MAG: outer membrane lipoprotein carrier protein LolA [Candidatus Latescibacteria bacterium]|nr:outer membrane lipoprotein carrier protein LolA [Candidatus Latescibacterota bacterium]